MLGVQSRDMVNTPCKTGLADAFLPGVSLPIKWCAAFGFFTRKAGRWNLRLGHVVLFLISRHWVVTWLVHVFIFFSYFECRPCLSCGYNCFSCVPDKYRHFLPVKTFLPCNFFLFSLDSFPLVSPPFLCPPSPLPSLPPPSRFLSFHPSLFYCKDNIILKDSIILWSQFPLHHFLWGLPPPYPSNSIPFFFLSLEDKWPIKTKVE